MENAFGANSFKGNILDATPLLRISCEAGQSRKLLNTQYLRADNRGPRVESEGGRPIS